MAYQKKKGISGSKYVFLNYLKGRIFAWLTNTTNYRNAASKDQMLIDASPWRWKQINLPWGKQLPWYELPTQMMDGMLVGEYIKEYFKKHYPNHEHNDIDVEEGIWSKKAAYTRKVIDTYENVVLFEPLFEYKVNNQKFRIKGDILVKTGKHFHLIEAKAVTVPLIYHAIDVKYQKEIIRRVDDGKYKVDENWEFSFGIMNKQFILESDPLKDIANLFTIWKSWFKSRPQDLQKALNEGKDISLKKFLDEDAEREYEAFVNFDDTLKILVKIQMMNNPPIDGIEKSWIDFMDSDYTKWAMKINGLVAKSIFEFSGDVGFSWNKKMILWNKGYKTMVQASKEDILPKSIINNTQLMSMTNDALLKEMPKQTKRLLQQEYIDKKEAFIQKDYITKWLDKNLPMDKPIIMFDFETASMAVPIIRGSRPYEQVPFQYSIHIITNPKDFHWKTNKNIEHHEYLAEHKDFYGEFWKSFVNIMFKYPNATFVSYNKSFENARATDALRPEKEKYLDEDTQRKIQIIKDKTVDLMDIFSNKWYYHDDFNGGYSIKVISTHFVPEIKYSDLDNRIQKGDQSAFQAKVWLHGLNDKFDENGEIMLDKFYDRQTPLSDRQWAEIREPMLKYCEYDTLAMVGILQHLLNIFYNEK